MNLWRAVLIASTIGFLPLSGVAAELEVIAGPGIAVPLKEIAAQFEKTTGHKLIIRYGTTPVLIKMATSGPFDLAIVPIDVMRNDAARAKFKTGTTPEVARVGMGVAVRSGAPQPDISTSDALKQTLLKAKSIASIPESATGYLLARIYEHLGISEEMKARIKPQSGPEQIVQSLARGDTELGVFLTNVLTAPGIDLVGPFPAEVQKEVVYIAGVSIHTKNAEAVRRFIAYIRSFDASAVIKSKGMTPAIR